MKKYQIVSCIFALVFLFACDSKNGNNSELPTLKPLNLSSLGIPFTIQAPDSAVVEREPIAIEEGISIRKGYFKVYLDIFRTLNEPTETAASVKQKEWETIKKDTLFESVKLIKEDADGFVYEMKLPKQEKSYGFFYAIKKEGVLYEFHDLVEDNFTQAEAEQMYKAVRQ
jgi:hypothetical protein